MQSEQGPLLALFARLAEPGRVKTRLAADIGNQQAAALYAAFTEDLVERLCPGNWKLAVATDPQWPVQQYQCWLPWAGLFWSQGQGDLGARLSSIVERAFAAGYGPVVMLGTDMPHLPTAWIQEAIAHVQEERAELVLGPASDGGYYLICMGRPFPLFDHIEWSSQRVLSQTLALAQKQNLSTVLLPTDSDVDTLSEWQDLARRVRSGEVCAKLLPRTARLADHWLDR